jgi:hypothetical protein
MGVAQSANNKRLDFLFLFKKSTKNIDDALPADLLAPAWSAWGAIAG